MACTGRDKREEARCAVDGESIACRKRKRGERFEREKEDREL